MSRKIRHSSMILAFVVFATSCGNGSAESNSEKTDNITVETNKTTISETDSPTELVSSETSLVTDESKTESSEPIDESLPLYTFAGGMTYTKNSVSIYGSHLINLYRDNTCKIFGGYYSAETGLINNTYSGTYSLVVDNNDVGTLNITYSVGNRTEKITATVAAEQNVNTRTYDEPDVIDTFSCYDYSFRAKIAIDETMYLNDYTSSSDIGCYYYMVDSFEPSEDCKAIYVGSKIKSMGGYSYVLELNFDGTFRTSFWWMAYILSNEGTYSVSDDQSSMTFTYDIYNADDGKLYTEGRAESYKTIVYPSVIGFAMDVTISAGYGMPGTSTNMVAVYNS